MNEQTFEDKVVVCRTCGKEFTFTAGEQEFYTQKGFSEPKDCKECRAERKANRNQDNY